MKKLAIGITCYPSIGGSGIVASQLGSELARLGHRVHFISYEPPFRLDLKQPNVEFHHVQINEYQLFKYPDYTLPLAVKMVAVAQKCKLDILHVHYAVPHATAALLATDICAQAEPADAARGDHLARHRHYAAGPRSQSEADYQVLDRELLRRDRGFQKPAARRPPRC